MCFSCNLLNLTQWNKIIITTTTANNTNEKRLINRIACRITAPYLHSIGLNYTKSTFPISDY